MAKNRLTNGGESAGGRRRLAWLLPGREFFDFLPDGYLVTDGEGVIQDVNLAAMKLLGAERKELVGVSAATLIAPGDREAVAKELADLPKSLRTQEWELEVVPPRGAGFPALVHISGLHDKGEQIVNVCWLIKDLTGQKRMQAELQGEQSRLARIVDSAMDAIVTVNEGQRITLFNAAAEKMFGWSAKEALGQSLDMLIPTRFRVVHREYVQGFGRTNVSNRSMGGFTPLAALRASGEEFSIESSISQVVVGGEKHYTAIVRDITRRLQAEKAARKSEEVFKTVFEHLVIGMAITDGNGMILESNPAFGRMLGYSAEELRGMPFHQITHTRDVKATYEQYRAVAEGATGYCDFEKRYLRKDGGVVWCRVVLSTTPMDPASPKLVINMVEDVTERKLAEARARRRAERHKEILQKIELLTDREHEVFRKMVQGKLTKVIARELGASPKTIEVHRARVMRKMGADSVAQLVKMAMVAPRDSRGVVTRG